MTGLPEVTIAGTMVADPELRFFPSGACVANFTLAANDRRYDRDKGGWVDGDATFVRCSIWRQAAENVTNTLTKGMRVLATGVLRQRSWENDQGEKRSAFELAVTEIGPSLKFATATVHKVTRSTGPATDDPWTSTHSGGPDEPPF